MQSGQPRAPQTHLFLRGFLFVSVTLNLMSGILTLRFLLMEMLGGAVLLILESNVNFVTAPTGHLLSSNLSLVKDPCLSLEIVSGLGRWGGTAIGP